MAYNNSSSNESTGFGSGSLGVTGENYDSQNTNTTRSDGVNTEYRHPLAGGAADVHPNLPPLGRALGASTHDSSSSAYGGEVIGGASHSHVTGAARNIPAELERSTGHSAQHRATEEGANFGGVGGIMGAGLEREGVDSSRRTHEQHGHESHTSGGRQIPTELERSQHGSSGLGATSGGVGGIMGAGLDREGHHHDSSAHRSHEHDRQSEHSSGRQGVLGAGAAGVGVGGLAAAGLSRDSHDTSRSTYDSPSSTTTNTSSSRSNYEQSQGQSGGGRVPQSVGEVKSVDDARAGLENLKMKHTDSEGFTDLTGGRQDKTDGTMFTGRVKNLDGSEKSPIVETSMERIQKDAQGRELDSYGNPYTL